MVREAIVTVLQLGVRFRQHWERGVARFGVGEAEEIEVEFGHCVHFLVSCLNKTAQKASLPHCEYTSQDY